MNIKKRLLDEPRLARIIRHMAIEVVEKCKDKNLEDLVLVGIWERGVYLAQRIARDIEALQGQSVSYGALEPTLHRDDLEDIAPRPAVRPNKLPLPVEDKIVVLVDDVFFTGRTLRAALGTLFDFGRPKQVLFAVLINRVGLDSRSDHREMPLYPNIIGRNFPTERSETITVHLSETDEEDEVLIS